MKLAYKIISIFWLLSPVIFLIGRACGIWNTKGDWLLFLLLMVMSGLSAFLNYEPNHSACCREQNNLEECNHDV